MTVTLHNGTKSGLFDLQGKCFYFEQLLDTARLSTLPGEMSNIVTAWNGIPFSQATVNLPSSMLTALSTWQTAGNALFTGVQTTAQGLLIQLFGLDGSIGSLNIASALNELIEQMVANSQTVNACAVTTASSTGSANVGNGVILVSPRRGDGRILETAYAETLAIACTNGGATANFSTAGQPSVNAASQAWPGGSGAKAGLTAISPDRSVLTNGGFETATAVTSVPDGWFVSVGTPGTQVNVTSVAVQQIVVSGSPTAGAYYLSWTNPSGQTQATTAIPYNSSAVAVQSALQELAGLSQVTVTSTGSSPNFTFTVTFIGVGGPISLLTVQNEMTGGSIVVSNVSSGTGLVYAGSRALALVGDGSTLTCINQAVTLTPDTVYGISFWANETGGPSAGTITVDLANGIGGSVITDDLGHANSFAFNANTLSGSWQHLKSLVTGDCCFKTPANLPAIVYLRIRFSTAVSNGCTIYFDQCALAPLTQLYNGGPFAGVFLGSANFATGDEFSITVTNNYGGLLQTAYNRFCGTGAANLLLPSSNSPTIPDSVISS